MSEKGPWGQFEAPQPTREEVIKTALDKLRGYLEDKAAKENVILNTKEQNQSVPVRRFYTVTRGDASRFMRHLEEAVQGMNHLYQKEGILFSLAINGNEAALLVLTQRK